MNCKKRFLGLALTIFLAVLLASAFAANNASVSTFPLDSIIEVFEKGDVEFVAFNSIPSIDSVLPSGKTISLEIGERYEIGITASELDDKSIKVKWLLDGKEVEKGSSYSFNAKKSGGFEIKAVASDGKASSWKTWHIKVEEKQTVVSQTFMTEQKIQKTLREKISKEPTRQIKALIRTENEKDLEKISKLVEAKGGKTENMYKIGNIVVVEMPAKKLKEIAAQNEVVSISEQKILYATLDASVPQIAAPSTWQEGYIGNGIRIAIIDTGIDSIHPMLQGKVAKAEDLTGHGDTSDLTGHGTHVAGIVAGTTANGGQHDGVAPSALLYNAKVFQMIAGKAGAYNTDVIAALNWAVDK